MTKIILTVGLSGSGKSTWAKKQQDQYNWKRVNKDDLRAMLDNSKWSKHNEAFVLKVRDMIVSEVILSGNNIIVDDTNLHPKHIERMKELAKTLGAEVEINDSFLKVSLGECITRDLKRFNSVGKDVIVEQYNNFLKQDNTPLEQDKSLPKAVIFDIDGTLAKTNGRSPYDYSQVSTDLPHEHVINVYKLYKNAGYKIIIFSGRDAICKDDTIKWLADNGIEYDYFDMREQGNKENDGKIKKEMFDKIKDKYYIEVVYDDRERVVKAWRSLGLKCFQVAEGNF